jgi:hypothetical protein
MSDTSVYEVQLFPTSSLTTTTTTIIIIIIIIIMSSFQYQFPVYQQRL